jgi:hypothetical protein
MGAKLPFLSILSLGALAAALLPTVQAQSGSVTPPPEWAVSRSADLTLTLECRDPGHISFEISNGGATDTALVLGSTVGNGRKYMITALDLTLKSREGGRTEHHYSPRDYPSVIGGTVGDWVQAVPARAAYGMSATPGDFFHGLERLTAFPPGAELSLRWAVRKPLPEAMLLAYWNGTLTSNACHI